MHDDTAEIIGTLLAFSPLEVFRAASPLVKLAILVIAGAGLIAVIAAIARRVSGGAYSSLLAIMGRAGLYAGVFGAGYTGMTIFMTAQQMHVARFVVYEPEVIEAVYVLLLGVIVWLIARIGNAGTKRR